MSIPLLLLLLWNCKLLNSTVHQSTSIRYRVRVGFEYRMTSESENTAPDRHQTKGDESLKTISKVDTVESSSRRKANINCKRMVGILVSFRPSKSYLSLCSFL